MISAAERKALKTLEEMVKREKDLHQQVDMFTDFAHAVEGVLGYPVDGWKRCSAPDAILGEYIKDVRRLMEFKKKYQDVKRDRCDTCSRFRTDIHASDPEDTSSRYCDWHEKFFEPTFYCKDWNHP